MRFPTSVYSTFPSPVHSVDVLLVTRASAQFVVLLLQQNLTSTCIPASPLLSHCIYPKSKQNYPVKPQEKHCTNIWLTPFEKIISMNYSTDINGGLIFTHKLPVYNNDVRYGILRTVIFNLNCLLRRGI